MPDGEQLFRKQALERAISADNLERLMPVVGGKDWLMIAVLGALMILVVLWLVVGRVPTIAAGRGVILRPHQVVDAQSSAAGRILAVRARAGDRVRAGDVIATVDQSEIRKRIEEEQRALSLQQEDGRLLNSAAGSQTALQAQQDRLERQGLEAQRDSLRKSLDEANSLKPLLEARANSNRQQVKERLLAPAARDVTDSETALRENEIRIFDYMSRLGQIDGQLRLIDTRAAALGREILGASAARRMQVDQLRRNLAVEEFLLRRDGNVVSQYSGRVAEVFVTPGQVVPVGGRLLILESEALENELVSISYFPVRDGKKILPGMPIQVTPDTVERERFGGIVGRVTSVSPIPVTRDGARSVLGNPELVQSLMPEGVYIEVSARLETDPSAFSGYRWSGSRGPDIHITAGLTHATRVTIERRAPITYLLPIFRHSTGIY